MASFLESKNQTWTQAAHILEQRSEFVFRELQTSTGELSAWSNFAGQFIEGLRTLAVQTVKSVDEVDQALNHLRELLEQLGLPPTRYAGIAELLYCAGRPHKAIEHWRATAADKSAEPDWLIRAHAEIDPYSAKLRYIVRLKDDKALVDAWGKAGENRGKEGEWTHHILASARNLKDWDVIGELLPHVDGIVDSLETLKLALQEEYRDFLAQFPVAFLQLLARTSEWQRLVRFAERQETGDNECDEILKHRSMGWDPVSLRAMAIRVVARSDDLSKEETKAQQAISEFLPRYLVSDRKAKPDERQQVQMLHKYLSVEEGGAALERANRLTFALEYYEQWFTETQFPNKVFRADKTKLRHARTRWVVCKRRLGEVTSGSQSEKHLQEAAISERRWSLSKENQPEIPKLAPLAGTVSLVDIVEADTKKTLSEGGDV